VETDTLAYYTKEFVMNVKSFAVSVFLKLKQKIAQNRENFISFLRRTKANVINIFTGVIYDRSINSMR
jgi:hypothetical protein